MKVLIQVTRLATYSRIKEMSQERFNELREALDTEGGFRTKARIDAEEEINNLINPVDDWQHDELETVDEFRPFVEET
jgi:ribosomal protein S13